MYSYTLCREAKYHMLDSTTLCVYVCVRVEGELLLDHTLFFEMHALFFPPTEERKKKRDMTFKNTKYPLSMSN